MVLARQNRYCTPNSHRAREPVASTINIYQVVRQPKVLLDYDVEVGPSQR